MRIVIDIDEETYADIKKGKVYSSYRDVPQESVLAIANGTPLPEGVEILTKEAYSDLCMRAADVTVTNVGYMDCIKDSTTDSSTDPSTVKPERKVGKWIDGKCNRCGTHAPFWAMASTYYCSEYCPNCGAPMEVEE